MPKASKSRRYQLQSAERMRMAKKRKKQDLLIDQNTTAAFLTEPEAENSIIENGVSTIEQHINMQSGLFCKENTVAEGPVTTNQADIDNDHEKRFAISYANEEVIPEPQKRGSRIVDIDYFVRQLLDISSHGPLGCTL